MEGNGYLSADPESENCSPRNVLEEICKILRSHHGICKPDDFFFSEDLESGCSNPIRLCGIIYYRRNSEGVVADGLAAVGCGDMRTDRFEPFTYLLPDIRGEAPDCAGDLDFLGDDIECTAAVDLADRENSPVVCLDLPGKDHLEADYRLCSSGQGVASPVGVGAVGSLSDEFHLENVS